MNIKRLNIISNNIGFGPAPDPTDEVEQHLTVSATVNVGFIGFDYGKGFVHYKVGREQQISIGKRKAERILLLVSQFINDAPIYSLTTDIGEWEKLIIDNSG